MCPDRVPSWSNNNNLTILESTIKIQITLSFMQAYYKLFLCGHYNILYFVYEKKTMHFDQRCTNTTYMYKYTQNCIQSQVHTNCRKNLMCTLSANYHNFYFVCFSITLQIQMTLKMFINPRKYTLIKYTTLISDMLNIMIKTTVPVY